MNPHQHKHSSSAFTLFEVLIAMAIVAMLAMFLLPATRHSREAARRTQCVNSMKQLSLACLNHESAATRYPTAMSGEQAAGSINVYGPAQNSAGDGYSMAVKVLVYLEYAALYDKVVEGSRGFTEPRTSHTFTQLTPTSISDFWSQPIPKLICPSYPGDAIAAGTYQGVSKPQVSNYFALVAGRVEGNTQQFADSHPHTGGVLVTRGAAPKGLKIGDISDGTAQTALLTESRSASWSAWFSGLSTSTIAIPPEVRLPSTFPAKESPSGLNYGSDDGSVFFWKRRQDQRDWGPSSAHAGDVVTIGFADGHVKTIPAGIDTRVFYAYATRGGHDHESD